MSLWPQKRMHEWDEFSLNFTALSLSSRAASHEHLDNVEFTSEMLPSKNENVLILVFFIGDILVNTPSTLALADGDDTSLTGTVSIVCCFVAIEKLRSDKHQSASPIETILEQNN